MPPLPKKKHSKGRKGKSAAHHSIAEFSVPSCPNCQEPKLSHRICQSCGYYDGKPVLNSEANETTE